MMSTVADAPQQPAAVAIHYAAGQTSSALADAVAAGLASLGKSTSDLSLEDLAPADEFHIGGAKAALRLYDAIGLGEGQTVLDVGCGIGGPARLAAGERKCASVVGVDLTPEFIDCARSITAWPGVGLSDACTFRVGDATDLAGTPDASFDRAYMIHVGMNIPDKKALAREIARVLRPGGKFGVWDIMRGPKGTDGFHFPVPFATSHDELSLGSPDDYRKAFAAAGLTLESELNGTAPALEGAAAIAKAGAEAAAAAGGKKQTPPLGLHIIMGPNIVRKMPNMIQNTKDGRLELWQMVWTKKAGE